jgi:hypothetical protein
VGLSPPHSFLWGERTLQATSLRMLFSALTLLRFPDRRSHLAKWKAIVSTDVAAYNNLIKQQEVPAILVTQPEAGKCRDPALRRTSVNHLGRPCKNSSSTRLNFSGSSTNKAWPSPSNFSNRTLSPSFDFRKSALCCESG